MRILVDENIPRMTVDRLRADGHDVEDVRGTAAQGGPDSDLWKRATLNKQLLIITDKGFVEYRNEPHNGILIVRLRQPSRQKIHDRVMLALDRFPPEEWSGLVVVLRGMTMSVSRRSLRIELGGVSDLNRCRRYVAFNTPRTLSR